MDKCNHIVRNDDNNNNNYVSIGSNINRIKRAATCTTTTTATAATIELRFESITQGCQSDVDVDDDGWTI